MSVLHATLHPHRDRMILLNHERKKRKKRVGKTTGFLFRSLWLKKAIRPYQIENLHIALLCYVLRHGALGHRISKSITLSRAIEAEEKKFDKVTKRDTVSAKREDKKEKTASQTTAKPDE